MITIIGADILSAASGFLGSFVNGGFGMGMQKRQQKYTRQNMEKQHEQNKDIQDREYQYNEDAANNADRRKRAFYTDFESPEAIMRQLKEAGLSPGLFYGGNGSVGGGGAAAQGGVSAPSGSGPMGAGYVNPGMGLDLSQIKLNDAQARKLNTEADALEGKNAGGQADIAQKLADAGLKDAQKTYAKAQAAYTEALTTATQFQNELTDEVRPWLVKEYEERVQNLTAQYEKLVEETAEMKEMLPLVKQKMGEEIKEIISQTILNATKNKLTEQEIEKVVAETWSTWAQAENEKNKYAWFQRELQQRLEQTGLMKQAMIISATIGMGGNVVKGLMDFLLPASGLPKLLKNTGNGNGGGYYGWSTTAQ